MSAAAGAASSELDELDRILADRLITAVYQPVIDLYTQRVTGYEALARGPEGSPLEQPDRLFAAGRAAGRVAELDWHCRAAAIEGALDAGMPGPLSLFINVEPESMGSPPPPHLEGLVSQARDALHVVVEFTDAVVTARPSQLLYLLDTLRELGWAIAVDDVGRRRSSLALMPVLRPDLVKLDLRLMHGQRTTDVAHMVNAISAEAERSGALVLVEGIETADDVDVALGVGASLGQGWFFGRPGPLPEDLSRIQRGVPLRGRTRPCAAGFSPYELVCQQRTPRQTTKGLLLAMTRQLEHEVTTLGESALLAATFQRAAHFTPATAARYAGLAREAAFVGALASGISIEPAPGVFGGPLRDGDPAAMEWDVAVVGPHFAGALVAHDLGDDGPESDRRFEYAITYQRDLAVMVAESLLHRIHPQVEVATSRVLQEVLGAGLK